MFKNSYILNFILWIFRCIRSSYVFYIAEKCVEGIAVCYDRSYLKMILCGKGEIERYANTSVLYKFINKTFSLILVFLACRIAEKEADLKCFFRLFYLTFPTP